MTRGVPANAGVETLSLDGRGAQFNLRKSSAKSRSLGSEAAASKARRSAAVMPA